MSANSIEQVSAYQAMTGNAVPSGWSERRKRGRIQVHWPLSFSSPGLPDLIETVTSNLSSNGFYFLCKTPFRSGEFRTCTLGVPTNHPWSADRVLWVQCKVKVIRIQPHTDGVFGIGCQIQDYHFVGAGHGFPDSISVSVNGRF
jgi:PilZ domain